VPVELLIDESKIRERLVVMGRQIEEDYRDKPLTIVAVLTGSLIALADLVRQIRIPLRIALLQASRPQRRRW
jgi:hypoxanthine phosphoribosyltransferase